MKSIVLDTNIFISALLNSKNCLLIIDALENDKIKLLLSEKILEEFLIVARSPKFSFTEYEVQRMEILLRKQGKIIEPVEKVSLCRDEKDNMVLECVLAGKADFIVTGDKDLLALKKFKNTRIITPQKFIKHIKSL